MTNKTKYRGLFLGASVGVAVISFFVGRHSAKLDAIAEMANDPKAGEAARQMVSDPKMAQALIAVNTVTAWGKSLAEKEKSDQDARAAAKTVNQNDLVRVEIDKVYRGPVKSLLRIHKNTPQYDVILFRYTVTNVSATRIIGGIYVDDLFDNFGNEYKKESSDLDDGIVKKLLRIPDQVAGDNSPDQVSGNIYPGEMRVDYALFNKPLPNAAWFVACAHPYTTEMLESLGSNSQLFVKLPTAVR
jgi:hypothetical protein